MSFAAPAFLWALLAIPMVVLLHFLRTQRIRRDVAALFLWREARDLAEAHRRISPTWLLLMQILFVAMAALALAQPRLSVAGPPDAVLVMDASASMAALEGGRTRLELAVERASAVAAESSRVAVVRAGSDVTIVHPLDADRGALGGTLAALEAGDRSADLARALDLAADVASGGQVHVFTDAAVAPRAGLTVHPIGRAVENVGIVAFDVGLQEAFVAVASNASRPQEVGVTLLQEGAEVASTSLFVPVGGQGTVTFPLTEGGIYEVRLTPPADDALALDDVAYAGRADLVVVLDRPVEPVQRALAALPGVTVRVTGAARTVPADVRVLTGADPTALGSGSWLLLPEPAAEPVYRVVRDVDRAHPLMRFVDIREAVVGLAAEAAAAPADGEPQLGPGPAEGAQSPVGNDEEADADVAVADASLWTVLARDASLTPVIRWRDEPDRQILQLAFHPSQSDVVLRPAFPALLANAVRAFRGEDRLPLGAVLPDGDGEFLRVLEPGVYDVGGRTRTASLLSTSETRLGPAPPEPAAGAGGASAAEGAAAPEDATASEQAMSFVPWLLAAALVALTAEWLLARRTGWWALRGR